MGIDAQKVRFKFGLYEISPFVEWLTGLAEFRFKPARAAGLELTKAVSVCRAVDGSGLGI